MREYKNDIFFINQIILKKKLKLNHRNKLYYLQLDIDKTYHNI